MRLQILGHGLAGAVLAEQASAAGHTLSVMDHGPPAASRVAAGLYTPVTGKRLTPTWALEEALPAMRRFYRNLEQHLGLTCLHERPTLRIFTSSGQRQEALNRPLPDGIVPAADADIPHGVRAPDGAVWITGGGWLDIPPLLEALEARRKARGEWGPLPHPDLTLHATGFSAATHPLWQEAGWRNAYGDVLTVAIPGLAESAILSFDRFLLPLGAGSFRLGATYFWEIDSPAPRPRGRDELMAELQARVTLPLTLTEHRAGIRPVALARVPILGPHPDNPEHWIFNGFGSKAVLQAPWLAERLLQHWADGTPLPRETLAPRRIQRQRDRNRHSNPVKA